MILNEEEREIQSESVVCRNAWRKQAQTRDQQDFAIRKANYTEIIRYSRGILSKQGGDGFGDTRTYFSRNPASALGAAGVSGCEFLLCVRRFQHLSGSTTRKPGQLENDCGCQHDR